VGTDPAGARAEPEPSRATHEVIADLRKELNKLVAAHHHRTNRPHGMIHAELRRACGGPPTAQASAVQLRARIDTIRRWG
jgi:hypothetical protein